MFARTMMTGTQAVSGSGNSRIKGSASTNVSYTYTASNSTTSVTQYKFGTASQYGTTTSSYIYTTTSGSYPNYMAWGTGNFTVEFWIYFTAFSGHGPSCDLLALNTPGGFGCRFAKNFNNTGTNLNNANPSHFNIFAREQADLQWWNFGAGDPWVTGSWQHCVIQRRSSTFQFWKNGKYYAPSGFFTDGSSRSFTTTNGSEIRIGDAGPTGAGEGIFPNTYIDEVCFSNIARYSKNIDIAVPTAPYTVDQYTTQLLHMDGSHNGTTFVNATS